METLTPPFKKLGLAITFSPTGKALLNETLRLKNVFNSELVLIHIGKKNSETEKRLEQIIENSVGINSNTKIVWGEGEPASTIMKKCNEENVDLLIAGALEKETLFKYYLGSVARKIMRESRCSVLIFTSPQTDRKKFNRISVSINFTQECNFTVEKAYSFAHFDNSEELIFIRDFHIPGLSSAVSDTGSYDVTEHARKEWQLEEEEKMKNFISQLNIKDVKVSGFCLYGKEGWESKNFVEKNGYELFTVTAPKRKMNLLDRIFPHELEHTFENLPTNILIIK